jgi:hypothetical protein
MPNKNWDQVGKADRHNNPTENRGEQTQGDESGNYCKQNNLFILTYK